MSSAQDTIVTLAKGSVITYKADHYLDWDDLQRRTVASGDAKPRITSTNSREGYYNLKSLKDADFLVVKSLSMGSTDLWLLPLELKIYQNEPGKHSATASIIASSGINALLGADGNSGQTVIKALELAPFGFKSDSSWVPVCLEDEAGADLGPIRFKDVSKAFKIFDSLNTIQQCSYRCAGTPSLMRKNARQLGEGTTPSLIQVVCGSGNMKRKLWLDCTGACHPASWSISEWLSAFEDGETT